MKHASKISNLVIDVDGIIVHKTQMVRLIWQINMSVQKIRKIHHTWIIGYLIIMTGINGCTGLFSPHPLKEASSQDIILAMKIKGKLIEAKELNAAAIQVESSNGSVTLSGFVETESQRQLAGTIARQTPDVKQIDNQIKVK